MQVVNLSKVSKTYKSGKLEVPVLFDVELSIAKGDMTAIVGPSGSGKSTLMNIIGLLDRPSTGELSIDGQPINLNMSDKKLALLRSSKIGFIFQTFNLLPRLTALGNVLLPVTYSRNKVGKHAKAIEILDKVGLKNRLHHRPSELSGGEKQRVAIARALINDPEIILADEPTGNLDSKTGQEIMELLKKLNKEEGKTIVIITHDHRIAEACDKTISIFDGRIK